jgi:hypothetical protein
MGLICWALRAPKKMTVNMSKAFSHLLRQTGRRPMAFSSTRVVPLTRTDETHQSSRALDTL